MPIRSLSLLVLTSLISSASFAEVTCTLNGFDDSAIEQTMKFDSQRCHNIDKKLLAYAKSRSEIRFKQEEEAKAKECETSRLECKIELDHLKNSHHWRLKGLSDGSQHQICMKPIASKVGQKDGPEYKIVVKAFDANKNEQKSGSIEFSSHKASSLIDVTDMSLEVMEIQYYDPIVDETPAPIKRKMTKETSDMMITCYDDKENLAINQSSNKKDIDQHKQKAKAKSTAVKK